MLILSDDGSVCLDIELTIFSSGTASSHESHSEPVEEIGESGAVLRCVCLPGDFTSAHEFLRSSSCEAVSSEKGSGVSGAGIVGVIGYGGFPASLL